MDSEGQALLTEFERGGKLNFDNAEQLYREAIILRENGALSRALCLHQISNEECGKLELLGGYAMAIVLDHPIDMENMVRVFRDHKAKNYANAYFSVVTDKERAARERADMAGASKTFKQ